HRRRRRLHDARLRHAQAERHGLLSALEQDRLARPRRHRPRRARRLPGRGKRRIARFRGMASDVVTVEKIASLCRRRGFVYPSSDIYGGLGSAYDYGHYGVLLRQNVKNEWWRAMIQERDDIVAIDSAIILNPQIWVASGHVGGFSDPMVDCRTCKLRFRADDLEHA